MLRVSQTAVNEFPKTDLSVRELECPRGVPTCPSAPAAARMSPTAQWTEFSRLSVRIQYNTAIDGLRTDATLEK